MIPRPTLFISILLAGLLGWIGHTYWELRNKIGIRLQLSEASHTHVIAPGDLVWMIDEYGQMTRSGALPIWRDQLEHLLHDEKSSHGAVSVELWIDRRANFGDIAPVLDACAKYSARISLHLADEKKSDLSREISVVHDGGR